MYKRKLKKIIDSRLESGKALVLYGPRRVGKTTLLKEIGDTFAGKVKFIDAEITLDRQILESENFYEIKTFLAGFDLLIIDEAQKIPGIGSILKLIVDEIPDIKLLVSGSASFELANQIGEPLTGRKTTLTMYPLGLSEMFPDKFEADKSIEERLIWGSYPKIVTTTDSQLRREELLEITSSYLFKDILELEKVRNPRLLNDLLVLLALQVGSEVSLNYLSNNLNVHITTVSRYLDLLQKVFVVFNLRGFSRNLASEINKTSKYYFYDNGIRNAVINNLNPLNLRDDVGKLWENFLMSERIKKLSFERKFVNRFFWRTYEQQEIDLIEELDGKLSGFEFKYGTKSASMPQKFIDTYPESAFQLVNKDNFFDFAA